MRREQENRKNYWLHKGIVVKIMTKQLGADYYKAKGNVIDVKDKYTALVQVGGEKGRCGVLYSSVMLWRYNYAERTVAGDVIKLDQSHLETVIPALEKRVLIVNGAYRNTKAKLLSIDEKSFSVTVKIDEGPYSGRTVERVAYEDVCKLAT